MDEKICVWLMKIVYKEKYAMNKTSQSNWKKTSPPKKKKEKKKYIKNNK